MDELSSTKLPQWSSFKNKIYEKNPLYLNEVCRELSVNGKAPESASATAIHKSLQSSLTSFLCVECTLKRDIFRFLFPCRCSSPFAVLFSEDTTAKTLLEIAKTALSLNAHLSYFADCAFRAALHIIASETKWIVEVLTTFVLSRIGSPILSICSGLF